jgi:DNA-binding XRE family transcriptional regulator
MASAVINYLRLKKARGDRSLQQIADLVGITKQQLWNIENAKSGPSIPVLIKLCTLYSIPIEEVILKRLRAA